MIINNHLLTAMEYFREEDSPEEHNNLIIEIINSDKDEPEEKRCIKLRIPLLKTIGDKLRIVSSLKIIA